MSAGRRGPARWAAALALAPIALTGCSDRSDEVSEARRQELLRSVSAQVERLLSYDAATLRRDVAEVEQLADGSFAREFGDLLRGRAGRVIRELAAVSSAQAVEVGTVETAADEARLLVFVRQATTSRDHPAPRVDLSAVEVTVTRVGDGWRIRTLEKVTAASSRGGER